jgi:hypothetical protein
MIRGVNFAAPYSTFMIEGHYSLRVAFNEVRWLVRAEAI